MLKSYSREEIKQAYQYVGARVMLKSLGVQVDIINHPYKLDKLVADFLSGSFDDISL